MLDVMMAAAVLTGVLCWTFEQTSDCHLDTYDSPHGYLDTANLHNMGFPDKSSPGTCGVVSRSVLPPTHVSPDIASLAPKRLQCNHGPSETQLCEQTSADISSPPASTAALTTHHPAHSHLLHHR